MWKFICRWGETSCPQQNKPEKTDLITSKWNFYVEKKMIWEKYLQICEGVNILKDIPFIRAYNYENHDNANRKMGKR